MMLPTIPSFDPGDTDYRKQIKLLTEHIQELHEQIQFMFRHIDEDNLAEGLKSQIAEGGANAEVTQRLEDAEGNILKVQQTAAGMLTRVENAEGAASQAMQTANQASVQVEDMAGNIASLQIVATGLSAAVNNNRLAFSAYGLQIKNAQGQTVFAQDNSSGNLNITGNISASGGYIGGLQVSPYGLFYGGMFAIDLSGSYPEIRIGGLTLSGNPYQGMIYGDPEAPIFAVNGNGVYVGRWQG